ncbi:hypothetical protein E1263_23740 [Kribbella antibiotica]|uniref:Fibronectin type III domain-containing protein n=1 Tax=Kribbella antibiotica TaxID=190195 RepID=A0A4R4ZGF4_9ACTN|nr:hypothetical protein [Kribbella antibiotica]TDD57465.1 hypothetical protein E1263_23740 [Kribbella antibiotica]
MRKFALAATAVAALSVGLQTPAFAAAPDAPTDVTVSWVDGKVNLTWKDAGEANQIFAEYDGGTPGLIASVTADGGNTVSLTNPLTASDKVRLIVKSVVGAESSEGTATPLFDTRRPAVPALQDANLAANLSTTLSWTLAAVADQNPGDPLDVPGNGAVRANVDLPGTATASYDFAAGETTGVVPAQARPTAIKLSAVNEWGQSAQGTKTVRLGTLGAAITVPSKAVYGARLGIKSTVDLFTSEGREERASDVKVELQARAKATDAWKTYGRYTGNTTAAFETGIASLGNRQYRLLLPARKVVSANVIALTPPTSTSPKSSTTLVKFASGGFSPAVGPVGTRWTFTVKIQPAVTVKGKLQFWDGKAWFDAGPLTLTKGSYVERSDPETERGTIRVRVIVPTVVVNGLTVNANTSPAYNQTIR